VSVSLEGSAKGEEEMELLDTLVHDSKFYKRMDMLNLLLSDTHGGKHGQV
jgi:hypothetical protein